MIIHKEKFIEKVLIEFANDSKMIKSIDIGKKNKETQEAILSYRTFRILFSYNEESKEIFLKSIDTGYSKEDLALKEDPYNDKEAHRLFKMYFCDKKCQ